ncbi:heme peroxidase family protein [Winogradskya consettensis]|uniref:Myeloperoxidase n=1 Tax=Winogradskya consettensis TaxID=113560 RepID=A0A919T0L4_9ACTN|nr:heme peroxidase family protein [Actinoplanes consettensis]GIM80478.1 myeloperoxidase [Actinoplanes consettensis]
MKRHTRDNYYVVGEGILTTDGKNGICERPSTEASLRKFRFSRIGPKGDTLDPALLEKIARAMTAVPTGTPPVQPVADPVVPAGFTYLGQFVDHDLTLDNTATALGEHVTVNDLLQGRSPALDLDSLYGRGPDDRDDDRFYAPDKVKLRVGQTAAIAGEGTNVNLNGYDLPRVTQGSTKAERQRALIPDPRNDENLVVAQTHLAFIRFHNQVVNQLADQGVPSQVLFRRARGLVVRHYQWMLRTDFLPRIVDPAIVDDVFANGRRIFEIPAHGSTENGIRHLKAGDHPTMPIEFSIAAYRLGHSMVRAAYDWNRIFAGGAGSLLLLFTFSGTSGNFDPFGPDVSDPETGLFERLPTNWAVDWRRFYDFTEAGRDDLTGPNGVNKAQRIDTLLVNPLASLPKGSFGGVGTNPPPVQLNLAFRNLVRAGMVNLATGQQLADVLDIPELTREQILGGAGGAVLDTLTDGEREIFATRTPLWFYVLREAELNGGRLTGVGGRIVAEVFHRAMEGSRVSIVGDPAWKPTLGPDDRTFRMVDLLLFAFEGRKELLAPLGD